MSINRLERMYAPEATMQAILDTWQAQIWTALPAIVDKVHIGTNMTIDAQPTVQATVTDKDNNATLVNMPLLVDLPIVFPSGGGFLLTFPVKPGDEVLVIFASRCIDAWWQSGGVQPQIEFRMHDLSDGFALPGIRSLPKLPAGAWNPNNVQLRNDANDTFVSIAPDKTIRLQTPATVQVQASTIQTNGDWTHTGNLTATGNIAFSGGTLTHNGKNTGSTHKHSGVQTGGSNTGDPI